MHFEAIQLRADTHNDALLTRTATKVGETKNLFIEIFLYNNHRLACDTNSSVTENL